MLSAADLRLFLRFIFAVEVDAAGDVAAVTQDMDLDRLDGDGYEMNLSHVSIGRNRKRF